MRGVVSETPEIDSIKLAKKRPREGAKAQELGEKGVVVSLHLSLYLEDRLC